MSARYDLERRLADHYAAEAPNRAPDWVLERTLASVSTTPQRRTVLGLPWRFPLMPSNLSKLGVSAAAIAAIGVVALALAQLPFVGPAASATPKPSPERTASVPPPLTERFDSTFNPISMSYPAGWQTRPATGSWARGALAFGAPDVDVIFDPTLQGDLYFAIVSEPLDGQLPEDWCCSPVISGPNLCEGGGGHEGSTYWVDGAEAGFRSSGGCGPRGSGQTYVFASSTHGYVIQFHLGDRRLATIYDVDWFISVLEAMDLRLKDAP